MNVDQNITFNVIYIPGTVRCLRIFAPSISLWGRESRYRLISNGCSAAEEELLLDVVDRSPRFEFYRLPGRETWEHGDALSHLQQRENGSHFAFFDSDIFASGDFLRDLFTQAGHVDALFSCAPVWSYGQSQTMPASFKHANCPYYQLEDGVCLGNSYFAIYDNHLLTECLRNHDISLNRYPWQNIPASIQKRLMAEGRVKNFYDTGKLANMLINLDGYNCRMLSTPHLSHIGGVSDAILWQQSNLYTRIRQYGSALVPSFVRKFANWSNIRDDEFGRLTKEELVQFHANCDRRSAVSTFIYRLLQGLDLGFALSDRFNYADPELNAEVDRIAGLICEHFPIWSSWLNSQSMLRRSAS